MSRIGIPSLKAYSGITYYDLRLDTSANDASLGSLGSSH